MENELVYGLAITVAILIVTMVIVFIVTTSVTYKYYLCTPVPIDLNGYRYSFTLPEPLECAYATTCAGILCPRSGGIQSLVGGVAYKCDPSGVTRGTNAGGVGTLAWVYDESQSRTTLFMFRKDGWHKRDSVAAYGPQDGDYVMTETSKGVPPFLHVKNVPNGPSEHTILRITGTENGYVLLTEQEDNEYHVWVYVNNERRGGYKLTYEYAPTTIRATVYSGGEKIAIVFQEGTSVSVLHYSFLADTWQEAQTIVGSDMKVGPGCNVMCTKAPDGIHDELFRFDRESGLYLTGVDSPHIDRTDLLAISAEYLVSPADIYTQNP